MGMYTEIIFGAALKEDTPQFVINTIQALIDGNLDELEVKPEHRFFQAERSHHLLCAGGSYYFPGTVEPKFYKDEIDNCWRLHFRSNIKNYGSEIELFLDWIGPYVEQGSGLRDIYAYVMYEEQNEPTIYALRDEVALYHG